MDQNQAKKALYLALASALTALGWSAELDEEALGFGHFCLRVVGFPNLRTPELRFPAGTAHPEDARFVWDGYNAKKPETMAKRLAKFLEECAADRKAAEAAKTVPLYLTAAERAVLENSLRFHRGTLSDYIASANKAKISTGSWHSDVDSITDLLKKVAEMGK